MSQRKWMSCVAAVAVVAFAACGGDGSTGPGDGDLTSDQLQSMSSALTSLLANSIGQAFASPEAHENPAPGSAVPVQGTTSCAEGGRVSTSGTFSNDADGNGIIALTDTIVDCALRDRSTVWTFTSKPTITATIVDSTNIHGDSIDVSHSAFTQAVAGRMHYSSDAASGTCTLNVSIAFVLDRFVPTADSATISVHTRGTVCGQSVSQDETSTFPYTPPNI
ncbi:MAG TPA: hypothetical protein VK511_03640 [Gemmatimonadaceae bacterium]|nr:hypothetical protein [Gemmatimonadaceae bacterium]